MTQDREPARVGLGGGGPGACQPALQVLGGGLWLLESHPKQQLSRAGRAGGPCGDLDGIGAGTVGGSGSTPAQRLWEELCHSHWPVLVHSQQASKLQEEQRVRAPCGTPSPPSPCSRELLLP